MTFFPAYYVYGFQGKQDFYDPVEGHTGADYFMDVGMEIRSPIVGTVRKILVQNEMGTTLYIEDDVGNIHVFGHLLKTLVTVEQRVNRDQLLALSGNTGTRAGTPHVHYEIIAKVPTPGLEYMTRSLGGYSGYNIDPEIFLQALPLATSTTLPVASTEPIFRDVLPNSWYAEDVEFCVKAGLFSVSKNRLFDPHRAVSRAELAAVLARLLRNHLGSNP